MERHVAGLLVGEQCFGEYKGGVFSDAVLFFENEKNYYECNLEKIFIIFCTAKSFTGTRKAPYVIQNDSFWKVYQIIQFRFFPVYVMELTISAFFFL